MVIKNNNKNDYFLFIEFIIFNSAHKRVQQQKRRSPLTSTTNNHFRNLNVNQVF